MPGYTKIEVNSDGSSWVEVRAGIKKYFGPKHRVSIAAREGSLKLDEASKPEDREHNNRRVLYRDKNGKLGVPPHPDMIPKDCDRIDCTSLNEEDKLASEMRQDLEREFSEDHMTGFLDQTFADENGRTPREIINSSNAYKTDFGREMCQAMVADLDREERNRNRSGIRFFFHTREYDK